MQEKNNRVGTLQLAENGRGAYGVYEQDSCHIMAYFVIFLVF